MGTCLNHKVVFHIELSADEEMKDGVENVFVGDLSDFNETRQNGESELIALFLPRSHFEHVVGARYLVTVSGRHRWKGVEYKDTGAKCK